MTDAKVKDDEVPDELTVTLRKPISFGGISYDRLILREPTAGQMMEWDGLSGYAADVKAVTVVSGVPEPAVKLVGARDLKQAAGYISRFL